MATKAQPTPTETIYEVLGTIPGWLTFDEGMFLYHEAKKVPFNGYIVEIGSWKGRSTSCLAHGATAGHCGRTFAVDPHTGSSEHTRGGRFVDTFEEFRGNVKQFSLYGTVVPIRKSSADAVCEVYRAHGVHGAREIVKLVFIDGAHEFRFVRQDLKLWFPLVLDGGTIALHDSWHFPGVNLASALMLLFSSKVRKPGLVDTITHFEKCMKNTWRERIENIRFVTWRTLVGWKGFLNLKYHGSNP